MSERRDEPRALNTATGTEAFQWALIRVVPRVERGEQLNAGVIVYSKRLRYLALKIELDEPRLRALFPGTDVAAVRGALTAFERACADGAQGRPHASASASTGSPLPAPRWCSPALSTAASPPTRRPNWTACSATWWAVSRQRRVRAS